MGSGKPVEVRARTPTGPKITEEDVAKWNAAADQTKKQQVDIDNLLKMGDDINRMKNDVTAINQKLLDCVTNEQIKDTLNDVQRLKEAMNDAQHDIKWLTDELNKLKQKVDHMIFPSMDEFATLRNRVDKLEN